MKCPKCQFENPAGAKFCIECGAKMELACPNCGTITPAGSKFCLECGQKLTGAAPEPPKAQPLESKLTRIQKYLPRGLAEKILAQKDRIEGERKQVTVMFCDLEGFTPMVEKLGPEDAYLIMDKVYEILIHKVHDYEGTVNEMTGDGIMALFGAPIALEDAAQRAVRSALAIHRELARLGDRMNQEEKRGLQLKMRIGIHTGPVVVGTLGNDLRVDFKAVGDTVNLASRMEGLAEPGATYVTGETYRAVEGYFRFESLGLKWVKGREQPVNVYRVIGPGDRRTRFDVSAERGLTPFVGRERELEIILDGFERAKAGRGQAFSIVSEAGVGKSRILYELRKSLCCEDVLFLEGRCLSYSRAATYHPIIDILKANFDIRDGDGDSIIRNKVVRGLNILNVDEGLTLPYFLELFSVKGSGIDQFSHSPETMKNRIIDSLKQVIHKGSEIRPLILAFEDLHWSDKSSEEILKLVLDSIPGTRILMLFTYRPDFIHTWGARTFHNQITLNRLSNRESLKMVRCLLDAEYLDHQLEELVLEKTEGIPFFIEEFTRSLKDLKIIEKKDGICCLAEAVKGVAIPSTIQDVIMSRVDALPEGAKELLQTGSSIEREFNHELIKRVTGLGEEELLPILSTLKDSELLYERGIYPRCTYVFRHALTREVVYDSILTKKKKQLHYEIGKAVEDLYKDNIAEQYGVLIKHFLESGACEKAAEYAKLASKRARTSGCFDDAVEYEKQRISCLEEMRLSEAVQMEIIDARATLGMYYTQINNFVLAREAVEPIVDTAVKLGYDRRMAQIRTVLSLYAYAVEEDFPKALKLMKEAISFGSGAKDRITLIMANHYLGHLYADDCEFEKALHHLEKSLDINVQANVAWGIAVHKGCIARTVHCYQGDLDLGIKVGCEALQLAEENSDIYSQGEAHVSLGYAYLGKGFLDKAEKHLIKGSELTGRLNMASLQGLACSCLGETYFHKGEFANSVYYHNNAVGVLEMSGQQQSIRALNKIGAIRAGLMLDHKPENLDELHHYANQNKIKLIDGEIKRKISEILLFLGGGYINQAETWIQKALETDKQNRLSWQLAMDWACYAKIFEQQGNRVQALECLSKVVTYFEECGAAGWINKYEQELLSISP